MPEYKTKLLLGAGAIVLSQTITLWAADLVPAALRDRANVRMTIANSLIDSAAERLAG